MKINIFLFVVCLVFAHAVFAKSIYVSTGGNDYGSASKEQPLKSIQKGIDMAVAGDSVIIREGAYRISQPVIISKHGEKGKWITIKSNENERVTINGNHIHLLQNGDTISKRKAGLLHIEDASYIRLENIAVLYSRSIGILVKGKQTNNIDIIRCKTDQTFGSGIAAWYATNVRIKNCEVSRANNPDMKAKGIVVRGETPHEAISIAAVQKFEVAYNHVYLCYKEGIDCKETSAAGVISNNHVHHCDRQGIYIDSWFGLLHDVEIYRNEIHHCEYGIAISSEGEGAEMKNVLVFENTIYRNRASGLIFGIWGHDGPRAGIEIFSNAIVNNGTPGHWSGPTGGIDLRSENLTDIKITGNVCSKNWSFGIGTLYNEKNAAKLAKKNISITKNLVDAYPQRPFEKGEYPLVYAYKGETTVVADPLFNDPEENDFSFHPKSPVKKIQKTTKVKMKKKENVQPGDKVITNEKIKSKKQMQ